MPLKTNIKTAEKTKQYPVTHKTKLKTYSIDNFNRKHALSCPPSAPSASFKPSEQLTEMKRHSQPV